MAGRPSVAGLLAFSDANAFVTELAAERLPVVKSTPVLAGGVDSDPFRVMRNFLPELIKRGYSGVQHFPSYGGMGEMAEAGADVLVPHMGGTAKGFVGVEKTRSVDPCIELTQPMVDTAKQVNPDIIVLCHGGPLSEPEDVKTILSRLQNVAGFCHGTHSRGMFLTVRGRRYLTILPPSTITMEP